MIKCALFLKSLLFSGKAADTSFSQFYLNKLKVHYKGRKLIRQNMEKIFFQQRNRCMSHKYLDFDLCNNKQK